MPTAAGVRREVEQHDGDLALGAGGVRRNATSRATRAPACRARSGCDTMIARAARRPPRWTGRQRSSAQTAPSSSGIATIIVASTGSSPRASASPLLQGLEFHRMRGDIGHIQRRQHFLGRVGVVVGGAADQAESGQRDDRVDRSAAPSCMKYRRSPGADRVRWRRPGPAQSLRLQRRDHAVIMRRITGQRVGPHASASRPGRCAPAIGSCSIAFENRAPIARG